MHEIACFSLFLRKGWDMCHFDTCVRVLDEHHH